MVKVDLITGFLGSGKTTFLLKYARHLINCGERVGILEYDYGAVNIDMLLLSPLRGANCEIEMLAAACDEDCLRRRFATKLIAMAMTGYDRVIIEPSGVFDVDMFFDALRDDPLENMYEIGNVFTIIGADLPDTLSEESNFYLASQAAGAGRVIISKAQLFDEAKVIRVKEQLFAAAESISCRDFSPIFFEKNWDELTLEDFENLKASGYKIPSYKKLIAGEKNDFSAVCSLNVPEGIEEISRKIKELFSDGTYGKVLRVKGFVRDGGQNYRINATEYEIRTEATNMGQNTLIVIGSNLDRDKILNLIER